MSVIGYVPVHIDASTRMEVRDGERSSWLNLGKGIGAMHVHASAPEDAERCAEAFTELARRMREPRAPMSLEEIMAREG